MVDVYKNIIINLQGYSVFSMIILYSATHLTNLLAFSLVATQIFQREKIKNLIENVIDKLEASKFCDHLESAVFANCAILFIYFWVIYVLQVSIAMKISLVSILGGFFIIYPYFVFFGFLSIVRNFEALVAALLKDFEIKLNRTSTMKSSDDSFGKLLQEYQDIYNLSNEFNRLFGAQLTMLFCSSTLLFTFQVITDQTFNIKLYSQIWFQLFEAVHSMQVSIELEVITTSLLTLSPDIFYLVYFMAVSGEKLSGARRRILKKMQIKANSRVVG